MKKIKYFIILLSIIFWSSISYGGGCDNPFTRDVCLGKDITRGYGSYRSYYPSYRYNNSYNKGYNNKSCNGKSYNSKGGYSGKSYRGK